MAHKLPACALLQCRVFVFECRVLRACSAVASDWQDEPVIPRMVDPLFGLH